MELTFPADVEDFAEAVLDDAIADWLGVYEVWWDASSRYPTLPPGQRLAIVERVVTDLVEAGRARLTQGPWDAPEREAIPPEDATR